MLTEAMSGAVVGSVSYSLYCSYSTSWDIFDGYWFHMSASFINHQWKASNLRRATIPAINAHSIQFVFVFFDLREYFV